MICKIIKSNIFASFAITIIPFLIFTEHYIVGLGDDGSGQIFGYYYFIKNAQSWSYSNFGVGTSISYLPWYGIFYVVKYIVKSDVITNHVVLYLTQYFLPFFSISFFLKKIFNLNRLCIIVGALYYVYNPYHLVTYFSPVYNPILIFFPFAFAYYVTAFKRLEKSDKYNKSETVRYAILISLFIFLAHCAIARVAYANIFFVAFLLYYIFKTVDFSIRRNTGAIKRTHAMLFLTIIFSALLNMYWVFNDFQNYFMLAEQVSGGALREYMSISAIHFHEAIRLLGDWGFKSGAYYDSYHQYHKYFYTPVGILFTYLLLVFVAVPLICREDNRSKGKDIFFMYIYLLTVFVFQTGTNPPLGFLVQLMYDNFNFFTVFRNPSKFSINTIFIYSVLLSLAFNCLTINGKLKDRLYPRS